MKTIAELMGGASFKEAIAPRLERRTNKSKSVINRLLDAIDLKDTEALEVAAKKISKPLSTAVINKISKCLLDAKTWPADCAEILDAQDIFPAQTIVEELHVRSRENHEQSWQAVGWMFRNDEACAKTRRNNIKSGLSRIPLNQENINLLLDLNWEMVMRGTALENRRHNNEQNLIQDIVRRLDNTIDPQTAGKLIAVMIKPKVMHSMVTKCPGNHDNEKTLNDEDVLMEHFDTEGKMARILHELIECEHYIQRRDISHLRWVEEVIEKTPELHETWTTLWNTSEVRRDGGIKKLPGNEHHRDTRSLIELMVRLGPSWIDDALNHKGDLGECIRSTMMTRDNLSIYLYNIEPARVSKIMPDLIEHFSQWEDENGNGLGLTLHRSTRGQRGPIRTFLTLDENNLAFKPNNQGETLIGKLDNDQDWAEQKGWLANIKQQALSAHLADTPRCTGKTSKVKL